MTLMNRVFLGIDPGARYDSGGLTLFREDGILQIWRMPLKEEDIQELFLERIVPAKVHFALLEHSWVRPGQGIVSQAKLVRNCCICRGMLLALKIDHEEVEPKFWQNVIGIQKRIRAPKNKNAPAFNFAKPESDTQWKKRLQAKAMEIFPGVEIELGPADSVLLAEAARRMKQ
jgi:hypothetical protein